MPEADEQTFHFEAISRYQLTEAEREEFLRVAKECAFNWCTKDQWPMGVIMTCLWRDGRMWLTVAAHRARVAAVRRNPKVSLVINGLGSPSGQGRSVTIKGTCVIHTERATKDWFYPAFSEHAFGAGPLARRLAEELDSENRVVLEVVPEKFLSYDEAKNQAHRDGTLDESQLAPMSESDRLRVMESTNRLERTTCSLQNSGEPEEDQ
jgi:general stress protein 26